MNKFIVFILILAALIYIGTHQSSFRQLSSSNVKSYYVGNIISQEDYNAHKLVALYFSRGEQGSPLLDRMKAQYGHIYAFTYINVDSLESRPLLKAFGIGYFRDSMFSNFKPILFLVNPRNGYREHIKNPADATLLKEKFSTFLRNNRQ